MIWEDERAPADRKLSFVLHLGDFIYEVVEYPDEVSHRYSRTVYDLGRIPDGRKVGKFPRADQPRRLSSCLPRAYRRSRHPGRPRAFSVRLHRDNHEFSWPRLRASSNTAADRARAAAARRRQSGVVGNIPSRVHKASGPGLDQFGPPAVSLSPIDTLDDHGFGAEANNRIAVDSMTAYRAMRYGQACRPDTSPTSQLCDAESRGAARNGRVRLSFPVVPQE